MIDDVDAVEAADASIDAFINKRAKEKADANKLEEFWAEQDRRHREHQREANRQEWLAFYEQRQLKGPRLEKRKHLEAEARIRQSVLSGKDYPGKAEDMALIRRKQRELGSERLRRVVGYGQEGTAKGGGGGYGN